MTIIAIMAILAQKMILPARALSFSERVSSFVA
jgi:hypothetical protein